MTSGGRVRSWSRSITICFPSTHEAEVAAASQPAWRLFRVSGGKRDKQLITLWASLGSQTKLTGVTLLFRRVKARLGLQGVD